MLGFQTHDTNICREDGQLNCNWLCKTANIVALKQRPVESMQEINFQVRENS